MWRYRRSVVSLASAAKAAVAISSQSYGWPASIRSWRYVEYAGEDRRSRCSSKVSGASTNAGRLHVLVGRPNPVAGDPPELLIEEFDGPLKNCLWSKATAYVADRCSDQVFAAAFGWGLRFGRENQRSSSSSLERICGRSRRSRCAVQLGLGAAGR